MDHKQYIHLLYNYNCNHETDILNLPLLANNREDLDLEPVDVDLDLRDDRDRNFNGFKVLRELGVLSSFLYHSDEYIIAPQTDNQQSV